MAGKNLKVLIVSTEVNPYAKSGGLGDVVGSLPKELKRYGVDIRIVLPKYGTVKKEYTEKFDYKCTLSVRLGWRQQNASVFLLDDEVPAYFIENNYYFGRDGLYGYGDDYERFAFFSKASIEFLSYIDFQPDIIHFNDWQTGIGCLYLNDMYKQFTFYSEMKTLFTVHNLQYQGVFGKEVLGTLDLNEGYMSNGKIEFHNNISFMKAGLMYCDTVSTVSKTYADEIQTPDYGYGMDGVLRSRSNDLYGIINGIDYKSNNPETDPRLFVPFSKDYIPGKAENKKGLQKLLNLPQKDVPVISIISRLVDQKGLDLVCLALDEIMSKDVQVVILGTGDGRYENMFKHYAWMYPEKMSANILFDQDLAQKIYGGSDIFLMPSMFEPCGLGQMFAMRYGTVPVVRNTGGLADTVSHYNEENKSGNGFVFNDYDAGGMMWALNEALRIYQDKAHWNNVVYNGLDSDFSWENSAKQYIELYENLKNKSI